MANYIEIDGVVLDVHNIQHIELTGDYTRITMNYGTIFKYNRQDSDIRKIYNKVKTILLAIKDLK